MNDSTSKYYLDAKMAHFTETQLLLCSGLPRDHFYQINVKVGKYEGEDVLLRTVVVGENARKNGKAVSRSENGKRTYVLVHGYAGSGALLYKVFKGLSEHFNLIVVDIIGMGSSSRPNDFKYE